MPYNDIEDVNDGFDDDAELVGIDYIGDDGGKDIEPYVTVKIVLHIVINDDDDEHDDYDLYLISRLSDIFFL